MGEGEVGALGPYRREPRVARGAITHRFLPEVRAWFAPLTWTLALLTVLGLDSLATPFQRTLVFESVVLNSGQVAAATCHDDGEPFLCQHAVRHLDASLSRSVLPRTTTTIISEYGRVIPLWEARNELTILFPTPPPATAVSAFLAEALEDMNAHHELGRPRRFDLDFPRGRRNLELRVDGENTVVADVCLLLAILLVLATVPTRLVQIRFDPTEGTLRIGDHSLFRRVERADCLLRDVVDVQVVEGKIVFALRDGSGLRLTATDRRPIELKERTTRRLRRWLEAQKPS